MIMVHKKTKKKIKKFIEIPDEDEIQSYRRTHPEYFGED